MKNIIKFISILSSIVLFLIIQYAISSCNVRMNKEHPQIIKGETLYKKYCLECHAIDGKGTESFKEHYTKIDLTKINVRRDVDEFPIMEIARYIDGRSHFKEFGERAMPMWGLDLMSKESSFNPDTARSNMGAIISYLIKIQD